MAKNVRTAFETPERPAGPETGRGSESRELRSRMLSWRNRLSREQVMDASARICSKLERYLAGEKTVLCYAPLGREVDLMPLCERLLALGVRLYFPRTSGEQMEFFRVRDLGKEFREGAFHVMEPVGNEIYRASEQPVTALVPGIVFDRRGNRMGFGRGYYDRYLSAHPKITAVGICYEGQLCERLQPKPWDVPMDVIVTEYGICDPASGRKRQKYNRTENRTEA